MAEEYEVNGAARIYTGTGTAQALEPLGYSFDGITVAVEIIRVPIHTDQFGGPEGVPAGFQYLGEFAHVRAELIFWDNAVFNKVWANKLDGTVGTTLDIGTVLDTLTGNSAGYHRLAIRSPIADRPYDWARSFLKGSPRKVGTRVTRIQAEWYCWQQAAASGTNWFDRTVTFP